MKRTIKFTDLQERYEFFGTEHVFVGRYEFDGLTFDIRIKEDEGWFYDVNVNAGTESLDSLYNVRPFESPEKAFKAAMVDIHTCRFLTYWD